MKINDLTGERFGKLVVIDDDVGRDKCRNRILLCQCDCGNQTIKLYGNLKRGTAYHCGCVDFKTKHGECGTRMYHCWRNMLKRASERECCGVYEEWKEYTNFRDWSLANGYTDELALCREEDKGNYEPGNVRWDTPSNNTIESNVKHWVLTDPEGNVYNIQDLKKYLIETVGDRANAYAKGLSRVADNLQPDYKGWVAERIGRWK